MVGFEPLSSLEGRRSATEPGGQVQGGVWGGQIPEHEELQSGAECRPPSASGCLCIVQLLLILLSKFCWFVFGSFLINNLSLSLSFSSLPLYPPPFFCLSVQHSLPQMWNRTYRIKQNMLSVTLQENSKHACAMCCFFINNQLLINGNISKSAWWAPYCPHLDWSAKPEMTRDLLVAWVAPGGVQHGSRGGQGSMGSLPRPRVKG